MLPVQVEEIDQQLTRYQRLLESTRAVPWEVTIPAWNFTYIGPQVEAILGYSVETWQQPGFWVDHIHPEDKEWAPQFCQDATSRYEDHEFEYRMIAADGRVVWLRDIVSVIVEDSVVVGLYGFMIDVTERKQSELVMRTLASTGSTLDIEGFYKSCVKTLANVYGCKFSFIGLLEENQEDVRTVGVWAGDDFADNFDYNLEGTPCKDVLSHTKELIPRDASRLYSDDELLVQMGVESYFGAPLITAEGKTVGLVSVMDTNPMKLTKLTAPILSIFATRIAVETERQAATNKLSYSQNALTQAQHIANIGSFEWDQVTGNVVWSSEAITILDWQQSQTITADLTPYCEMIQQEDRVLFDTLLGKLIATKVPLGHKHCLKLGENQVRHVEFRAHFYFDNLRKREILIGTIHDVTEHHEQEQALQRMANYDALTGLPNRWLLHQKINDTITDSRQNDTIFCLALLDLDGFKEINDTLGHFAGDQLLRQLKPRFDLVMRPGDYIARLGGDEFAIIFNPISDVAEGERLTEIVRNAIAKPFVLEQAQIQVGASIGLSIYPEHGTESSELLRHADVAMYQAKSTMAGHVVYDAERDPYGPRRLSLINDIRSAISQDELLLHYQPKIDAKSGKITAVEALVRWQHPVHGNIPPIEFIPFCEVNDLIHDLTDYVMHKALTDAVKWQQHGLEIKVAVNIASRNLMNYSLPEKVESALKKTGATSSLLQLEITENDLMNDPDRAMVTIQALSDMGIGLSIDDFGTGYSSLAYLKHLRVQELKIDKSFVRDMLSDENDTVIVKSIIDLGHSLGLHITAEGVESDDTLQQLIAYGCESAQGFYIAKPMPGEKISAWIANNLN